MRVEESRIWSPEMVPGCILYAGAYQEARATRAAQPVLVDGDMEAAGVAAWKLRENSALAKKGDPYAGLQCLRLTNAGFANRYTDQAVGAITGNRYRITGAARGDGSAHPRIGLGSTGYEWIGTTSNLWQPVSGDYNWTASASIYLYAYGADTKYAEFDSLTLANLSLQSYTPAYTTIPGSVLAQATATAQPWVSSDGLGIRYQGGDRLQWSAAESAVKCLHDGTGGTLIVAVRPSVLAASLTVATTSTPISTARVGVALVCTSANQAQVIVMNGSGAFDLNAVVATPIAINTTYVLTMRIASGAGGVRLRKNGTEIIKTALTAPSAANPSNSLTLGSDTTFHVDGVVGHPFVANRVLTDAECTQVENYILAQATL